MRVKLAVSAAYKRAERVLEEVGEVVSVVKETWEAVLAEKAVEGMPSLAASHAAPLSRGSELCAFEQRLEHTLFLSFRSQSRGCL